MRAVLAELRARLTQQRAYPIAATALAVPLLVLVFLSKPVLVVDPVQGLLASVPAPAFGAAPPATTGIMLAATWLLVLTGLLARELGRWQADRGRGLPEHLHVRLAATVSFAAGFLFARGVVLAGSLDLPFGPRVDESFPIGEVWIAGFHLHHFFLGVALMAIVGWLALARAELSRVPLAVVYGLGLGIFVDEVGLLLTWGDYHARESWLVAVLVLGLLLAATQHACQALADEEATESGEPEPAPAGPGEPVG